MMLTDRIRAMTGIHWLAFFGLLLVAWCVLFLMAIPGELRASGMVYGADLIEALCTITPDAWGFVRVFAMWVLMSAAMMAPTALPAFSTFDDLPKTTSADFAQLVYGFMAVWLGFSVFAAAVQIALVATDLVSPFGDSRSAILSALLLAVAGLYQFSPLKEACLSKCRAPLAFFMQHWGETPWRMGVRLGAICLGCCWALMLLAFVGGVMNLAFMGLATIIMMLEKLPEIGRYVTKPLGVVLLLGAVGILARAAELV